MSQAHINIEALSAHIAAQNKKIQATRDNITALQCEVATDATTLQNEDLKESVSVVHGGLRVVTDKTDDIPHRSQSSASVSWGFWLPASAESIIASFLTKRFEQDPLSNEAPNCRRYRSLHQNATWPHRQWTGCKQQKYSPWAPTPWVRGTPSVP